MSLENVEIVRRCYEALNQRDVDEFLSHFDSEAEVDFSESIGPFSNAYRGHAELKTFWESFFEAWDEIHWEIDELLDLGRDRVLTETHLIARGPGSGIPTTNYRAVIWKIRDGQIRRMKFFPDTRDALEAARPAGVVRTAALDEKRLSARMESRTVLSSSILPSMAGKENADAVRITLRDPRAVRRGRTLDERLYVRFRSLLPRIASAVMRLLPRSRIRQALLARSVQRGWAASDRGDLELALCSYDPDVEIRWPTTGAIAFPDLKGVYRGHEGYRQVWRALHDPWEVEVHLEEVIDAGHRMLVAGHAAGQGKGSGIAVDAPFFALYSFRAGRIISEQYFNGRDEAFAAAGLKE